MSDVVRLLAELADGSTWPLAAPVSLAPDMPLDGSAPRWFDAPPAHSWPHRAGDFSGSVVTGASCNCRSIQLTPHGSGTHTEGVGHLSSDEHHVRDVVPDALLPALLLRVAAMTPSACGETSDSAPRPADSLLSARALAAAWPATLPFAPQALVLASDWQGTPPYLSRECAQWVVARGIRHLVVDLPSLDRLDDGGQLTAHRIFFGLPARREQSRLPLSTDAQRADSTVTELASIPPTLATGPGFLQIQVPALAGDAIPSRPLWHALRAAAPQ